MSLTDVERFSHQWNVLRNNKLQQVASPELLTATLISLGEGEMFCAHNSLDRDFALTRLYARCCYPALESIYHANACVHLLDWISC